MPGLELVTGATGFLGRALAARLAASGARVRCLARPGADVSRLAFPGAEILRGDLLDKTALAAAVRGADRVWHLGALVRPKGFLVSRQKLEEEFRAVNAAATGDLARAAAEAGAKRFIYFSTIAALGPGENLADDAAPRPLTYYGSSKLAGEEALKAAARGGRLNYLILRPAMTYGPGAPGWEGMFRSVRLGAAAVPGDGANRVSVCGLENLLDAALLAAEKARPGAALNVSEGSFSVRQLLDITGALAGTDPALIRLPVNFLRAFSAALDRLLGLAGLYMPGVMGTDAARLLEACSSWSHDAAGLRALGWKPAVSTSDGLAAAMGLKP
jgi:nucleoside-diphosphate-sugar epimerase